VLLHWAAVVVGDATGKHIRCGRPLVFTQDDSWQTSHSNRCRAYTRDGCFLGLLRFNSETGQWQPEKVFTGS
jgi:hypothetical protein